MSRTIHVTLTPAEALVARTALRYWAQERDPQGAMFQAATRAEAALYGTGGALTDEDWKVIKETLNEGIQTRTVLNGGAGYRGREIMTVLEKLG